MLNFSKGLRRLCRNMLWLRPVETEHAGCRKDFLPLWKKKSNPKEQFYNNDFMKVVIDNSILDAQRDLHTSKCKRPHNRPYDGCLWKLVERNKVCASKLWFVASTETFNGNHAKELHYIDVQVWFMREEILLEEKSSTDYSMTLAFRYLNRTKRWQINTGEHGMTIATSVLNHCTTFIKVTTYNYCYGIKRNYFRKISTNCSLIWIRTQRNNLDHI